ncbi:MAG: prepilin-type N-terminal cleavage/methylation domain-containing protein [Planctomycetota bacterium]|jgi:prepilin-type N-terminal cleavage/methylation domain-containing protein
MNSSKLEGRSMANRPEKTNTGFTIVELLLALAIAAMLLAAVAVAFNASVVNYKQNEDIFKTINSARQALFRITSQLRTASAVDPNAPTGECSLFTAGGEHITYRYDNADEKLYLITNDDLSDSDYVLCDDVAAMTFIKDTVTETVDVNGVPTLITKVKSVQTSMTVQSGNLERTVTAAAVVRKNLN